MVDQTKVETSEAKANELEKKVKDAEMFLWPPLLNLVKKKIVMFSQCTAKFMFDLLGL